MKAGDAKILGSVPSLEWDWQPSTSKQAPSGMLVYGAYELIPIHEAGVASPPKFLGYRAWYSPTSDWLNDWGTCATVQDAERVCIAHAVALVTERLIPCPKPHNGGKHDYTNKVFADRRWVCAFCGQERPW